MTRPCAESKRRSTAQLDSAPVYDVAVIGGGIVGTAAAAFLAEAGASVILFESTALGAGASGRNSGAIQQPDDPELAALHAQTLPLYRELVDLEPEFQIPHEPTGLLLVSTDEAATAEAAATLCRTTPELKPHFVSAAEMRALEPAMADDVAGVLLQTGYAVMPSTATLAFGRRALRAGTVLRIGSAARPAFEGNRAIGIRLDSGEEIAAGAVLVAGGPWSVELVPGWSNRPPIRRSWGVVVSVELAEPPSRILEELSIDAHGSPDPVAFSLMTAGGASSLGSTFLPSEPQPDAMVHELVERGSTFVPALKSATIAGLRMCARPVSFDGRPLIGPVTGFDRLFVCAGHGPWGISTGPASAKLAVDAMLGGGDSAIPPELAANRHSVGR
jgi:glycine/D-amino acid oxidase-like deaminating enzyme